MIIVKCGLKSQSSSSYSCKTISPLANNADLRIMINKRKNKWKIFCYLILCLVSRTGVWFVTLARSNQCSKWWLHFDDTVLVTDETKWRLSFPLLLSLLFFSVDTLNGLSSLVILNWPGGSIFKNIKLVEKFLWRLVNFRMPVFSELVQGDGKLYLISKENVCGNGLKKLKSEWLWFGILI